MAQRLTRDWDLGLGNFQKFEIFSEVLLLLLCSIISLFVINNNKASRKVRVIHPFSFNVDLVFMDYRNANFFRMGKTSERIQHFINLSHSFENDPGFNGSDIIVAFNGLLKSVDVAQKYHSDRTSS
ncbi:hypothetical protein H4Q26_004203 [Puccinia striiformis f. sp. tritici PST-130]|nr:hypothetical protein H4Q26_004203 [Puccinia striiformis f. sp. tritici PST-130]